MPFKANNNREAVVVCARHVVKRPSKRSVLVVIKIHPAHVNKVNLTSITKTMGFYWLVDR